MVPIVNGEDTSAFDTKSTYLGSLGNISICSGVSKRAKASIAKGCLKPSCVQPLSKIPGTVLLFLKSGNTTKRGRLSTIDLLIKVACFVKKVNNVCNI
jgi:hypothetical protein